MLYLARLITVALLLASFQVSAADRRFDKSQLVVMTFNGEFLWDGRAPEEGQVSFAWKNAPDEADERMEAVAAVIAAHNPDIVNLVEVEGVAALNHLNDAFLSGRGYKAYLVKGTDTFTGQDVGLLTRIDPEGGAIARDDRKGKSGSVRKSVSKNYFAKLDIGGRKVAVLGIHYLSRPDDTSRLDKRQAQADATLGQAMDLATSGYEIIVLGDFNDYSGTDLDLNDHTPITTVLSHLQTMSPTTADDDLVNALQFVPKAKRYTAYWDKDRDSQIDGPGEFSAIDHVLISKSLADEIEFATVDQSHDPRELSDHFPVVVSFKLAGAESASVDSDLLLEWALPNPIGDERMNEAVGLINIGQSDVSLTGWMIKDDKGRSWVLDSYGQVPAGSSLQVLRNGQSMGLNNDGDRIDLIDHQGTVRDSFTYSYADEGERLEIR